MAKRQTHTLLFILVTLAIFPLPQVAIDLYLPSLPDMAKELRASQFQLQMSLTAYILALGVAQLFWGPFSDRHGRKPALLAGSTIFFLGCFFSSLVTTPQAFILFRILQGIGMGCGFTVASAILGESFKGRRLARMTTFASMIYSLSPIIAPVIGGYLQYYLGWESNFWLLSFLTLLLILSISFVIPETNRHKNPHALRPGHLISHYWKMISHRMFICNLIVQIFAFGVMITFNVIAPFLLQNDLKISVVHYGQLLLLVGFSYFLGTVANQWLLKKVEIDHLIWSGLIAMLFFSVVMGICSLLGWFSIDSIMVFTCLLIFSTGLVFSNCFAKTLEIFPHNLGTASSLVGALGLIGIAIISGIVSHLPQTGPLDLPLMFIVQSLLGIGAFAWSLKSPKKI